MFKKMIAGVMLSAMCLLWVSSVWAHNDNFVKKDKTITEYTVDAISTAWDLIATLWENAVDLFRIPSADASNPLVTMAGNTASGAISGAGDIMSSDLWYVAYFVIGLSIISLVITAVMGFLYLRRGN